MEAVQERIAGIQEMSVTVSFVILDASPEVQTDNICWTFTDLNGNSFNIPTDNMMTNFSTDLTGVFSSDRLNLTLSGLSYAFEGTYAMMATNEAGSDSSEAVLIIEGQWHPSLCHVPIYPLSVEGDCDRWISSITHFVILHHWCRRLVDVISSDLPNSDFVMLSAIVQSNLHFVALHTNVICGAHHPCLHRFPKIYQSSSQPTSDEWCGCHL